MGGGRRGTCGPPRGGGQGCPKSGLIQIMNRLARAWSWMINQRRSRTLRVGGGGDLSWRCGRFGLMTSWCVSRWRRWMVRFGVATCRARGTGEKIHLFLDEKPTKSSRIATKIAILICFFAGAVNGIRLRVAWCRARGTTEKTDLFLDKKKAKVSDLRSRLWFTRAWSMIALETWTLR